MPADTQPILTHAAWQVTMFRVSGGDPGPNCTSLFVLFRVISCTLFQVGRKQNHTRTFQVSFGLGAARLCPKSHVSESAFSGRLKIAQRFIAGIGPNFETKSVKRTTEKTR